MQNTFGILFLSTMIFDFSTLCQDQVFQRSNEYAELSGIDGETIEFEWNISKDSHRMGFSVESRKI